MCTVRRVQVATRSFLANLSSGRLLCVARATAGRVEKDVEKIINFICF